MPIYIGFDVSKEETSYCAKSKTGKILVTALYVSGKGVT